MVAPQHPGNIGAAARALKTMGLRHLRLVRPREFPHTHADERAVGAVDLLASAKVFDTLEDAVADCAWVIGSSARPRHLGDEPLPPWEAAPPPVTPRPPDPP